MEQGDSNDKKQSLEEIVQPSKSASKTGSLKSESAKSVCKLCGSRYSHRMPSSVNLESMTADTSSNVSEVTSYMSQLGLQSNCASPADIYPTVLRTVCFAQLSKRPVNCPATKCGKLFAITQIINHIVYEHKKIPTAITYVYEETIVDFDVNKISVGETAVLGLLAIPRDMEKEPSPINPSLDNAFVFLIFGTKQALSSEQQDKGSFMDIWVSGYVNEIFGCTVEVYSDDRSILYTYHGAVNSLRDSNNSSDIFKRADGLLLHPVAIERMSQNEYGTIKLKVIIGCKGVDDY